LAGPNDPSDRELFDDAVGGLDQVDDRDDRDNQRQQPRDPPTGRFTRQQEDQPDDDQGDDRDQGDDGQDDDRGDRRGGTVPSYRQRSEAQRRRDAEDREQRSLRMFDQLAQRFGSLEEELRALRAPRQQQEQERPDVWRDPDGFVRDIDERFLSVEERIEAAARDKMINLTFRREHRARGQEFEQAYRALQGMTRRGDRVADEITNDADPGAALMEWYDGEAMRAEIGGDPDGYVERRTAERLKQDPKFRRLIAQQLGFELLDDDGGRDEPPARNGRSGTQTLVRLPSVNSASGRGGGGGGNRRTSGNMPVTDGDFFQDAVAGLPIARMRAGARGR